MQARRHRAAQPDPAAAGARAAGGRRARRPPGRHAAELNRVMPERSKRAARAVVAQGRRRAGAPGHPAHPDGADRRGQPGGPRSTGRGTATSTGTGRSGRTCATTSPSCGTVVPERLIGLRPPGAAPCSATSCCCVDQSGSMAASVVYASVFAAVLASLRTLRTSLVVFDTAVVDLTDQLDDPVDVLFGTQLGGGTDINRALAYCQGLVTRPAGHDPRADQRPVRGRRPRTRCCAGSPALTGGRRAGDRPAGAVRRGRARLRPRQRRGAGGARRAGVRLHARRCSRS